MADDKYTKTFEKAIAEVSFCRLRDGVELIVTEHGETHFYLFEAEEWREVERKLQIAK